MPVLFAGVLASVAGKIDLILRLIANQPSEGVVAGDFELFIRRRLIVVSSNLDKQLFIGDADGWALQGQIGCLNCGLCQEEQLAFHPWAFPSAAVKVRHEH
ncbi:hypothetical protein B0T37_17065 [Chromobacterium violaceum]|nr:hypothetical protein B0T38_17465 [Chromobacterium violaceum]OQS23957.1 hypothetical protein B0T37_17065 [Chromobacterium violaceum]